MNMTSKEKKKLYNKEYRKNNKEKIKKLKEKANIENPSAKKSWDKTYRQNNKEAIKKRNLIYRKNRKANDICFKLKCNMRSMLWRIFNNKKIAKTNKTEQILGCSFEEFKQYLESQFQSWMTWENYGLYNGELNYGWDIDHIVPMANATTIDYVIKLNHYTNLQSLCSKINRDIKKAK